MKHTALLKYGAALGVCLLFTGLSWAGPVPVPDNAQWTWQWTPSTSIIYSDPVNANTSVPNPNYKSSYILLIPQNNTDQFGNPIVFSGAATLPAVNLQTFSNSVTPVTFTNAGYGLGLTITDKASGQSGTLTFQNAFNGTLTNGTQASLPNTSQNSATQWIYLGTPQTGINKYTVTLNVASPGGPTSTILGAVTATANVTVSAAPEPSTMLLSGLGLSFVGLGGWLRRQRARRRAALNLA